MNAFAERTRWPDERLDDLAQDVRELRLLPERVATLTANLEGMRDDVNGIAGLARGLEGQLTQAIHDFSDETADHRAEERRANRTHRWRLQLQGTLQSAALIAAVVLSIVALLSHHP